MTTNRPCTCNSLPHPGPAVVTGAAGNVEGHSDFSKSPLPPWERWNDDSHFGVSQLTLHNASALTMTFRDATDGSVLDQFTLTKKR